MSIEKEITEVRKELLALHITIDDGFDIELRYTPGFIYAISEETMITLDKEKYPLLLTMLIIGYNMKKINEHLMQKGEEYKYLEDMPLAWRMEITHRIPLEFGIMKKKTRSDIISIETNCLDSIV